jgi:hypothetical protein
MKLLPYCIFIAVAASDLGACVTEVGDAGDPSDNSSDNPDVNETADALSIRYGVDYSAARPSPSALRADGFTFAARYESYDPGKNLSSSEAHTLISAGLDVVSVWETTAGAALGGYNQGVSDAHAANSQFASDGAPPTRPIYFAVDFDASASQQGALNAYFDGVASVIGRGRTGAYAGFYVIDRLFNAGKIKWAFQTYAWSAGHWDSRAQLRQIEDNILGACCDKDEAVVADFGQWGHAVPAAGTHGTAAVIDKNGIYHVFAVNAAGTLYHTYYLSGAWHWQSLGGTIKGHPGVTYDPATNRYDVFAPGTNGVIYQRTYSGTAWSGWHAIGGSHFAAGAAAMIDRDGIYHVFASNTSGTVYQAFYGDGVWHWQNLSGIVRGTPAVTYNAAIHRFDLFAPGTNGAMYQKTYSGNNWSGWHSIGGGHFAAGAAAVIDASGVYHVFAADTSGDLRQAWGSSGGWHWQSLGGTIRGAPGVTYDALGHRFDVFAPGTNGSLYQKTYANNEWSGWHDIGGHAFDVVDDPSVIDTEDFIPPGVDESVEPSE